MNNSETTAKASLNNGTSSQPAGLTDLISRHAELAKLELGIEIQEGMRRFRLLMLGGLLFTIGFCFLQIAIFTGLIHLGIPGWAASLLLGFLYMGLAGFLVIRLAARKPNLGQPFEGSVHELKRSFEWTSKRFF